ncbi:type I secretion protein [Ruegeria meonggei]|uniref:type I secretion protein n=1 Tax=Ruegeria meonggei TaxID=1446476 RepID=UPI0036720A7A
MALDSISEQIAHFVGAFELTTEQARLRDQYQEFTAMRKKAELEELEDPTQIRVKADLKLDPGEYDPTPYKFASPVVNIPAPSEVFGPNSEASTFTGPGASPVSYGSETLADGNAATTTQTTTIIYLDPEFVTELAGSAVTYTFQTIELNDNDTIGQGDFRDADALMAHGEEVQDTALSLHAVSAPSINISDYLSIEKIEAIAEEMQSPVNAEVEGATVHQFHGEDATGMIVNGEQVDEMPEWSDLLPKNLQPEEDTDDETPEVLPAKALPAEWDQDKDSEFEDGHTVTTGGNLAINEVAVTVGWVDAPNIVVGGQAVNLTVISQVAVVSDIDEGDDGVQSDTNVVQSSQIGVEAREAPWLDVNVAEPGQDPLVAIDWIEGDLVVTNFVDQVINATDIDHIETEISASSSMYALGDNVMANVTNILQLGSFYDLIIIGGNMISVDIVSQTIVLLDDDVITGGLPSEDNDNLVMNQVMLNQTGEDTHEELSDDLADVLPLQEVDADALEDALMNDPMFAGTELVRVLKIEGDLLQVNIIEQTTILQDQDDISLTGLNADEASVLGAGNAVLNTASINKAGIDSVVMAQEGEYSDLLLHQASLIDVPEEDSVEIANEAIAFLMEETDATGSTENTSGHVNLTPSETVSVDDGLHSMLA